MRKQRPGCGEKAVTRSPGSGIGAESVPDHEGCMSPVYLTDVPGDFGGRPEAEGPGRAVSAPTRGASRR